MDDRLLFLQCIAKMMEEQEIVCSFDHCMPRLDRKFWEGLAVCQQTEDHKLLENIAHCLRQNTSDFYCTDQIIALLERAGYSMVPRHDFG